MSDEHNGIIDLPEDAPVGTSFAAYAGLDDPVIEINLTPNRPDCTSVYGIARDLAAAGLGKLKQRPTEPVKGAGHALVDVHLELGDDTHLCPGFAWRTRQGRQERSQPAMAAAAVDRHRLASNQCAGRYHQLSYLRPRPAAARLRRRQGQRQPYRTPRQGRRADSGLNGKEYTFGPDNVVIADADGVESIGGIMGGEHSGCDENTTNVVIESALWDAMNIARTGRTLGIITDARYRFERGVDPEFMVPGLELATQLVLDFCGGTPSEAKVIGYKGHTPKTVQFPARRSSVLPASMFRQKPASISCLALASSHRESAKWWMSWSRPGVLM